MVNRGAESQQQKELIRMALNRNPYFTCMDEEQIERFIQVVELRTFRPGEAVILEGCRDERFPEDDLDFIRGTNKSLALADIDDLLEKEYESGEEMTEQDVEIDIPFDSHHIPPPSSGSKPFLYIIKSGNADVLVDTTNPATLGPGTLFGEGGFLFGRQHSASIVAAGPLECWVVDLDTFLEDVLKSQNLQRLFSDHAHREDDQGNLYMTMEDFIHSSLKEDKDKESISTNSAEALSIANAYNSILQSSAWSQYNNNRIYLADFCLFYLLISRPDPEVDIAFLLMDRSKTGSITKADFQKYLSNLPYYFDGESEFVQRHFGQGQTIRSYQFSQFLVDLQREMGRQAFVHQSREGNGMTLPPEDFVDLLKSTCGWRLPPGVVERLESLYSKGAVQSAEATAMASVRAGTIKGDTPDQVAEYSTRSVLSDLEQKKNRLGTRSFTYVDYIAFQEVLSALPGIYNLIERACQIKNGPISPDDFKVANRVMGLGGRLSRQQVDIVFHLFDLDRDGFVSAEDAFSVCGVEMAYRLEAVAGRDGKYTFAPPPKHSLSNDDKEVEVKSEILTIEPVESDHIVGRILKQMTQFILSSVAGGLGICIVYPLDLVKTRMMNQRIASDGKRMYLQSFDCLLQSYKFEGITGLYRGLLPPLLAVGPEKFIKFTVNDMLKGLSDKQQGIHWLMEVASGACAGACQLLVTNPLEITKIRMQLQGETARLFKENGIHAPKPLSFSAEAVDLGLSGLYKGAAACLLRDIPFGAIYFPVYALCKDYLVQQNPSSSGSASASNILLAGTLAGIPASFLTTPADMIKTRLQVVPRPGEAMYSGIGDCFKKVYKSEGPTAFFKGSLFRVCRIAPQFGISLLCYEKLSTLVGSHTGFTNANPPTNAPVDPRDYRAAFPLQSLGDKTGDIDNLVKNMGLKDPNSNSGGPMN